VYENRKQEVVYLPEGYTTHYWEKLSSKHRLMQTIRRDLNKLQNELVSIEEFCHYTSLKMEQVEPLIIG
jgi:hypothetical protein